MVRVRFHAPARSCLEFKANGHAGSGPKGFDLVCAAISAMVLTMLGGMESEAKGCIKGTVEEGRCEVLVVVPQEKSDTLETITRVFQNGFDRLAGTYPDYVEIIS